MKTQNAYTSRLGNRANNQDRCLVVEKPGRVLLAVADGMGGHERGDLAAQSAVDSLRRSFLRERDLITNPLEFLKNAMETAHLEVVDAGRRQRPRITPRTTCVVCLVQGEQAWWAHVGDSRLYLLRAGTLLIRTRDHTPVEELLQANVISEDQLRTHPLRNSVSRCLGGAIKVPEISYDQATLKPDDTLLLCSDGLWSALPEHQLISIPVYGDLTRIVSELTEHAEMASYPQSDNISVVCLRWLSAGHPVTTKRQPEQGQDKAPPESSGTVPKDPLQQAIDDIHRAMLEYASELKK